MIRLQQDNQVFYHRAWPCLSMRAGCCCTASGVTRIGRCPVGGFR